MCVCVCVLCFQVFYTEMKSGRPVGAASLMEVPLSLDMLTTVSTLTFNCAAFIPRHFDIVFERAFGEKKKKKSPI